MPATVVAVDAPNGATSVSRPLDVPLTAPSVAPAPLDWSVPAPLTTVPPHVIEPDDTICPPVAPMVHVPVDAKLLGPEIDTTALLRVSELTDIEFDRASVAPATDSVSATEPVIPLAVSDVAVTVSDDVPDTAPRATAVPDTVVAAPTARLVAAKPSLCTINQSINPQHSGQHEAEQSAEERASEEQCRGGAI